MSIVISDFLQTVSDRLTVELGETITTCGPLLDAIAARSAETIRTDTNPAVYVYLAGTGEMTPVATGELDVVAQLVAYAWVPRVNEDQNAAKELAIVRGLLDCIPLQRWGLPDAYPATGVEAADLHGLIRGFKPDTSSWRVGVSVLSRAAELYGSDNPDARLGIWCVTWEQTLRFRSRPDSPGMDEFPNRADLHLKIPGRDPGEESIRLPIEPPGR